MTPYAAARDEILERMRLRDQFLLSYVVVVGAVFGIALEGGVERLPILLIVPYLTLGFTVLVSQHHSAIGSLLAFCARELVPSHGESEGPVWELSKTYHRDFAQILMRRSWAHAVLTAIPSIAALVATSRIVDRAWLLVTAWWFGAVAMLISGLIVISASRFRRQSFHRAAGGPAAVPHPLVIAHRTDRYDESRGWLAIEEAIAGGATMVEIDIHQTRDRYLVIHHDDTFGTPPKPWAEIDLMEGSQRIRDLRMLQDCIRSFPNLPFNLEIKSFHDRRGLIRSLVLARLPSGSIVSSKYRRVLRAIHGTVELPLFLIMRYSSGRTSLENLRNALLFLRPRLAPAYLAGLAVDHKYLLGLPPEGSEAESAWARRGPRPALDWPRRLRRQGLSVIAWVVDDPERARDLATLGVDGLMTRRPREVREALDRMGDAASPPSAFQP